MVSRREILSTVAGSAIVSSTGCLGLGSSVRSPEMDLTVAELPSRLADLVTYDAELLEGFTADHPARIRVSTTLRETPVTEDGATLRFGETPPYSFYLGGQPDMGPAVAILPEDPTNVEAQGRPEVTGWIPEEPEEGCWRAPTWPQQRLNPDDPTTIELEPGETLSTEYVVLSLGDHCLPDGEYRFTGAEPFRIESDGEVLWENDEEWIVNLRMTLG